MSGDDLSPLSGLFFCACCLRLGPLTVFICTTGFVDDVIFTHRGASGLESSTALCLEEFRRWQHRLDVSQLQCLDEFISMQQVVQQVVLGWLGGVVVRASDS